jgi:hypothetical protein
MIAVTCASAVGRRSLRELVPPYIPENARFPDPKSFTALPDDAALPAEYSLVPFSLPRQEGRRARDYFSNSIVFLPIACTYRPGT